MGNEAAQRLLYELEDNDSFQAFFLVSMIPISPSQYSLWPAIRWVCRSHVGCVGGMHCLCLLSKLGIMQREELL